MCCSGRGNHCLPPQQEECRHPVAAAGSLSAESQCLPCCLQTKSTYHHLKDNSYRLHTANLMLSLINTEQRLTLINDCGSVGRAVIYKPQGSRHVEVSLDNTLNPEPLGFKRFCRSTKISPRGYCFYCIT